jgi:hypothetical protein
VAIDRARFYAVTDEKIEGPDTLRNVTREDVEWFINVAGPNYKGDSPALVPLTGAKTRDRDESGLGIWLPLSARPEASR